MQGVNKSITCGKREVWGPNQAGAAVLHLLSYPTASIILHVGSFPEIIFDAIVGSGVCRLVSSERQVCDTAVSIIGCVFRGLQS